MKKHTRDIQIPSTVPSDITSILKKMRADTHDELSGNDDGWISTTDGWTFLDADSPTFRFTISGDYTKKYCKGMKLRLYQSSTIKYFIISINPTYSSGTGLTTVTIYGGTDYTLASSVISNTYYSLAHQPFGFDRNPDKWSIITTLSGQIVSNPAANTYYSMGYADCHVGTWIESIQYTQNNNINVFASVVGYISETSSSLTNAYLYHKEVLLGMNGVILCQNYAVNPYALIKTAKTRRYVLISSSAVITQISIDSIVLKYTFALL